MAALLAMLLAAACSAGSDPGPAPAQPSTDRAGTARSGPDQPGRDPSGPARPGPWHTQIPVTTFWVGELFDPGASDGSQRISTYDNDWVSSYGGCDGVVTEAGICETERRYADEGWFPRRMEPRQNPFYLDVPYDDVHDETGFARRCAVIPWADPGRGGRCDDRDHSYLKNVWLELVGPSGRECYGQVQDAGPGEYDDARYVFGDDDARPANQRYGGAGMDVSPALNGCLGLASLDGTGDLVRWRFVPADDVPDGPWRVIVTTSPVAR